MVKRRTARDRCLHHVIRLRGLLVVLLVLPGPPVMAQEVGGGPGARPSFRSFRYEEDWRALADPARQTDFLDPLKYIRLGAGPDVYLSFGGELRERYEFTSNPSFRVGADLRRDDYLLQRLLLHADLHLGPNLRVFTQIGDYRAFGRAENLGPTQENRLDLAQAFADLSFDVWDGRLTLRGGRQEMAFGSQRLISVRDGPNVRRAFDGGRVAFALDGGYRVDAFLARPVAPQQGTFNDSANRGEALWGIYGTGAMPGIRGLSFDLYYLGYERQDAEFVQGVAFERRHTVGVRLFGRSSGWDWNFEGAYQFGSFGQADIRAWTVASDTGYTLPNLPWSPRLGLKADIASGDGNPNDRRLGTFNALYPKAPYFTELALVAPANLIDVFPSLTVRPTEAMSVEIGWDLLWRHRRADAFYTLGPFAPLPGSAGGNDSFIGHQAQLTLTWQINRHLEARAWYVHFAKGPTIERAGGRDVDFLGGSVTFRF
jgi:hypothetical protein